MSVGKRLVASVAKGISLFTQSLGIKMFAAKGKVEIQAQSDSIEIIADKVMKLISAKESIEIAAKKSILLTAGGSYIRIDGSGIEEGTLGSWKAWAGGHDLPGPKSFDAKLPELEALKNFELKFHFIDDDDNPIANTEYLLKRPDGTTELGKTDENGFTETYYSMSPEEYSIHLLMENKQAVYGAHNPDPKNLS